MAPTGSPEEEEEEEESLFKADAVRRRRSKGKLLKANAVSEEEWGIKLNKKEEEWGIKFLRVK